MLSLFVGAVTMSMSEAMADMKREAAEARARRRAAAIAEQQRLIDELAARDAAAAAAGLPLPRFAPLTCALTCDGGGA
jgi:sensor histidine kinase regulating citrate/malate metabolism